MLPNLYSLSFSPWLPWPRATAVTSSHMLDTGVSGALPPDRRGVTGSRIDTVTAFYLAQAALEAPA